MVHRSTIFGVLLLLFGIARIVTYFFSTKGGITIPMYLVGGIVISLVGIVFLVFPGILLQFLSIALGIFFVVLGVAKLQTSIVFKATKQIMWWISTIVSCLIILMGISFVIFPFASTNMVIIVAGVVMVLYGAHSIYQAIIASKK